MRLFSLVFTFIVITILFGNVLSKIETIEQLENQLEQNKFQIDSKSLLEILNGLGDNRISLSV